MKSTLDGRILFRQIRIIRGLRTRLARLQESRALDLATLEQRQKETLEKFERESGQLSQQQRANQRKFITDWDDLIEKQIALAERSTLQSLQSEKRKSKDLKHRFIENKAQAKADYETATANVAKGLQESKAALAKARDSIKAKLEQEKENVSQCVHEAREWINIRTGDTRIQELVGSVIPDEASRIATILDLSQIAKEIDEAKNKINVDFERIKRHPVVTFFGTVWCFLGGVLLGAVIAAIAWLMQTQPIVIGLAGLVGTIFFSMVLYFASMPQVRSTIRRLFPAVVDAQQQCHLLVERGGRLAENSCQNEISKKEQQSANQLQTLETEYRTKREKLLSDFELQSNTIKNEAMAERKATATKRSESMASIESERSPKLSLLQQQQSNESSQLSKTKEGALATLRSDFERAQFRAVQRWQQGTSFAKAKMKYPNQRLSTLFPAWDSPSFKNGDWPRERQSLAWPIGTLSPHLADPGVSYADGVAVNDVNDEPWPVLFDVIKHGSLWVEVPPGKKEISDKIVRNTILRAITSLPAGSLQVTVIDPEGLGNSFSWLMGLADVDPVLVNSRVWTQPMHIAQQLSLASHHVEDVIQQSLRNHFQNLAEYNAQAGPMAVPYRLIVWSGFPFGLDDHSWQSLCSIVSSGGMCGVGVIVQSSTSSPWPTFADRSKIEEFGLRLRITQGQTAVIDHPDLRDQPISLASPPDDERLKQIMAHQIQAAANVGKCVVPFGTLVEAIQKGKGPSSSVFSAASAEGLTIPIGIADSGKVQSLRLGHGTSQHVLIAGKTGSGKSSLLHTLITSAVTRYPAEELRLILLDFKKGVEFQVYAETALSHADIIGIESKREFGVSTLEYVDRVLTARGEAFRQWGVQDLPSLARKFPDQRLPRILILIDEFQEMFVEDDRLAQQASLFMDRIVRQGRSFGVHLVLASQTLGGAYSLPRTTLAQMGVRVALQCDSSDAMLILSEDNTAAERLRHSGQAIYNESGGRFESNENFQVAFLEKSEQIKILNGLSRYPIPTAPTINAIGRQVVFEGHKPAVWTENAARNVVQDQGLQSGSLSMMLGESVSIEPAVEKTLSRSPGRNVMVVGQDESCAASLLASLVAGNCDHQTATKARLVLFDGSRTEDINLSKLVGSLRTNPPRGWDVQIGDHRSIDVMCESLSQELQQRLERADSNRTSDAAENQSVVVAIANLSRFRDFRKGDEYSFGDDAGGSLKPDSVLANLLRDGPSVGVFVWIWADSAGTLTRWISRQSLRDLELRILMQMSASDSNTLIDSNAANRLDRYLALLQDDVDGKAVKFRPYDVESVVAWLQSKA